jgi:hypothetical protein
MQTFRWNKPGRKELEVYVSRGTESYSNPLLPSCYVVFKQNRIYDTKM